MSGGISGGVKSLKIMEALNAADRPLKSSEIEAATGIYRTSVSKHINWNMLHKYVTIAHEEPQKNGHTIKYYALNPAGKAKMEAM